MTTQDPPAGPRDPKAEAAAAKAYAKAQRPWFKKKRWIISLGFVALAIAGAAASPPPQDSNTAADNSSQDSSSSKTPAAKEKSVSDTAGKAPAVKKAPELTSGQKNALEAAKNYLDMSGFSKAGLISQLSSSAADGYSKADATYGATHAGADWNQEAVEAAKNYLDMTPMSKTALINQLTSSSADKFTEEQARYAASKVY